MPASRWHHVSVRDPKVFKIVATKQFGKSTSEDGRSDNGIQARLGRERGKGPTRIVTLLFDPRLYSIDEAAAWARKHGETVRKTYEAPHEPGHKINRRAFSLFSGRMTASELRELLKKTGVSLPLEPEDVLEIRLLGLALSRAGRPDKDRRTTIRDDAQAKLAVILKAGVLMTPGFPSRKGSSAMLLLPFDPEVLAAIVTTLDVAIRQNTTKSWVKTAAMIRCFADEARKGRRS